VSDRIELRAMRFEGRHGALAFERDEVQPFEVDVVLELDLGPAGRADDLERTVDYGAVFARAREVVEGPPAALLETLAERIAVAVLADHGRIDAVTVRVRKLRAPLPGIVAWAGVEVRRVRRPPPGAA
jgi:7,8-dihydroneopterin aldolase/epimerase/oxygenase